MTEFDFTRGAAAWEHNDRVADMTITAEGLAFRSTDIDPYLWSKPADYPDDRPVRVTIRMRSTGDTSGEVFYGREFVAGKSASFVVRPDGEWHEYTVVLPPLGKKAKIRLDPSGGPGEITVAWVRLDPLPPPPALKDVFVAPSGLKELTAAHTIESGLLKIRHDGKRWGGFELIVSDRPMAVANPADHIVEQIGDGAEVLDLESMPVKAKALSDGGLEIRGALKDTEGATWTFTRRITPASLPGAIEVETELRVDHERAVYHLPWLTLFPGLGAFGERKHQGLFAGVEYLADEPSSSEKDVRGPKAMRRLPARHRITFPLMAIKEGGSYVGLAWEDAPDVAALFDSPDRVYKSGAHLLSLVSPAVGEDRIENELLAFDPMPLHPGNPLRMRATILGGRSESVVGAVQAWVGLRGLPDLPEFEGGFDAATRLLAHGWLDSAARQDSQWRHAVWPNAFGPQPAADAPAFMERLAQDLEAADPALAGRLDRAANRGLEGLPDGSAYRETVGHVVFPVPPLLFGRIDPYIEQGVAHARNLAREFDEKGILHYHPRPGKPDYASTHWADHANGLAAPAVHSILAAAALSGDDTLLRDGVRLLDALSMYDHTVPRGAQTWEIPLHTPDILASAHLVEAYTLGYELTGKSEYLDRAKYWAWTGVPFIYLSAPTSGRVGVYATTAVLGATNWEAPYWIGQPVQWCGLVYGSALHHLARHDPDGPWTTLAKGITRTGLQMTWPESDQRRQGLLPDFFHLVAQVSDGPAINPGTVQSRLLEAYDRGTLFDFQLLPRHGWWLHAPCEVGEVVEEPGGLRFPLDGVGALPYSVLIARVNREPMRIEQSDSGGADRRQFVSDWSYDPDGKRVVVRLKGPVILHIRIPE